MEELTLTADTITINKHELYDVFYSIFSLEKSFPRNVFSDNEKETDATRTTNFILHFNPRLEKFGLTFKNECIVNKNNKRTINDIRLYYGKKAILKIEVKNSLNCLRYKKNIDQIKNYIIIENLPVISTDLIDFMKLNYNGEEYCFDKKMVLYNKDQEKQLEKIIDVVLSMIDESEYQPYQDKNIDDFLHDIRYMVSSYIDNKNITVDNVDKDEIIDILTCIPMICFFKNIDINVFNLDFCLKIINNNKCDCVISYFMDKHISLLRRICYHYNEHINFLKNIELNNFVSKKNLSKKYLVEESIINFLSKLTDFRKEKICCNGIYSDVFKKKNSDINITSIEDNFFDIIMNKCIDIKNGYNVNYISNNEFNYSIGNFNLFFYNISNANRKNFFKRQFDKEYIDIINNCGKGSYRSSLFNEMVYTILNIFEKSPDKSILSFVCPNSFIIGGVGYQELQTYFSKKCIKMFLIDLHGNGSPREKIDGDGNLIDNQTHSHGYMIMILVKDSNKNNECEINKLSIIGNNESKMMKLNSLTFNNFKKTNENIGNVYNYINVFDMFNEKVYGPKSNNDKETLFDTKEDAIKYYNNFINNNNRHNLRYNGQNSWDERRAIKNLNSINNIKSKIITVEKRPFEEKFTFYVDGFIKEKRQIILDWKKSEKDQSFLILRSTIKDYLLSDFEFFITDKIVLSSYNNDSVHVVPAKINGDFNISNFAFDCFSKLLNTNITKEEVFYYIIGCLSLKNDEHCVKNNQLLIRITENIQEFNKIVKFGFNKFFDLLNIDKKYENINCFGMINEKNIVFKKYRIKDDLLIINDSIFIDNVDTTFLKFKVLNLEILLSYLSNNKIINLDTIRKIICYINIMKNNTIYKKYKEEDFEDRDLFGNRILRKI